MLTCLLIIVSPGPDSLLVIARGISQGKKAAIVSSVGVSCGLLIHAGAAAFGLALLLQTSALAFTAVKVVGAGYLIWLGLKALFTNDLISFSPKQHKPMKAVFWSGFFTNVLNPKPLFFILAFVPQFISPAYGDLTSQTLQLGAWYAVLALVLMVVLSAFSARVAGALQARQRLVTGLNKGAGLMFLTAGLSVAFMERDS